MNDPLMRRELELAHMRTDERVRVAKVDRLLRERRAAEPRALDNLLDAVAGTLITAGERLKARQLHRPHPYPPHSCPERSYM